MRFIPVQAAQVGMIVARDIVFRDRAAMLKKGMTLTPEHISYLVSHGYNGIYISDRISEGIVIEETIPDEMFRAGMDAVENENVGLIINSATDIVHEIISKTDVNVDLIDLRGFDDYTYHHSVNVAIYSIVVGKVMGLSEKEILLLSQAALCHDLGKMAIPEEIINKPGKLTDEEFEIIKSHPRRSVDILDAEGGVSALVKNAVLFHHENENGSGYPMRRTGSQLHVFAKILHAVDVYDALTSKRPYKNPYAPSDAFDYLKQGCDILFDRSVVEAMVKVIPAYPPGIDVKLSNGQNALVYSHTTDATRPKVKIIDTGEIISLQNPKYADLFIAESGIMPVDYAAEVELLNETRNIPVTSREKILVVDDASITLLQVKSALEEKYDVITARSGLQAIGYINKNGYPDLIIVDIEMPDMSGTALIGTLKNMGMKNVPFIILSSIVDKNTVVKCIQLGASDYIVKPSTPNYIRSRVAAALGHEIHD